MPAPHHQRHQDHQHRDSNNQLLLLQEISRAPDFSQCTLARADVLAFREWGRRRVKGPGRPRLAHDARYADFMKARQSKFRMWLLVVSLTTCILFSVVAFAIAWNFDYFGWHSRARWFVHASEYKTKVI